MKQAPLFDTIKITSEILMIQVILLSYRLNGEAGVFQQKRKELNLIKKKEYIQFLEEILVQVELHYNGKVKGEICTSVKNNGVAVTGLMLKGEERVAPNFYLDKQFIEWMRGLCTMDEVVGRLCEAYEDEVRRNSQLLSKIQFSWEEFRRNVFMRLVNREKNEELLQRIPHKLFLDLAVVYYYSVPISGGVQGTMIITLEHLSLLGITEEELHQTAVCNCERFQPIKLRCMEEVVYELGRKIGVEVKEAVCEGPFLYVLTNTRGMFGAISMVFEKELERFSKRINNSFYVLPSSVHEVILVPACKELSIAYFANMVREINETQVEPTEVLSDSIYFYDKDLKVIRRVA